MPSGTLDLMRIDGQPVTYQIMFEQNAGGTFVARVDSDELVPFLHEEMRVELPLAESAAQRLTRENRVRLQNIFLEENNLHAVMDYLEEDI
jgi:DNA-binding GntR family transcriptional regulator